MGSPAAEPNPITTTNSKTDSCFTPRFPKSRSPKMMMKNMILVLRTVSKRKLHSSEPSKICLRSNESLASNIVFLRSYVKKYARGKYYKSIKMTNY